MVRGTEAGIKGRLSAHARSKTGWEYFSVFQVWDHFNPEVIVELEGILRHMYRFDQRFGLIKAKRYAPLTKVTHKTVKSIEEWREARQRELEARGKRKRRRVDTTGE